MKRSQWRGSSHDTEAQRDREKIGQIGQIRPIRPILLVFPLFLCASVSRRQSCGGEALLDIRGRSG